MNSVRISRVGARRTHASTCSRSRSWPIRIARPRAGIGVAAAVGMADPPRLALSAKIGSMRWSAIALRAPTDAAVLGVGLLQLTLGPLRRIFRLHALDRLRVHVHEDVLDERLGRLAARRARIAGPAAVLRRLLEGDELGILLPQGVLFPVRRR